MRKTKTQWCFNINKGARLTTPNAQSSEEYLKQAHLSLQQASTSFSQNNLLWTTVAAYYAEYYALYAFLQAIGITCENHSCSIHIANVLLAKPFIARIHLHKKQRTDAQYFMKIGSEKKVEILLQESTATVLQLDNLLTTLTEKDIQTYRKQIRSLA